MQKEAAAGMQAMTLDLTTTAKLEVRCQIQKIQGSESESKISNRTNQSLSTEKFLKDQIVNKPSAWFH